MNTFKLISPEMRSGIVLVSADTDTPYMRGHLFLKSVQHFWEGFMFVPDLQQMITATQKFLPRTVQDVLPAKVAEMPNFANSQLRERVQITKKVKPKKRTKRIRT